ncbi:hypothetical protein SESBI_31832 [Sesbania bispinosa]|nr:hypothetical protein SESBI_31832 [Sesbania bispinosa]
MQAVGRLGSYISQGVYTVSGPFHPFGGAVDIVVVEQEDGSFKSSPWESDAESLLMYPPSPSSGDSHSLRSLKENVQDVNGNRIDSMERAKIAANLLELKWSGDDNQKMDDGLLHQGESNGEACFDIAEDDEHDLNDKDVELEGCIEKQLNGKEISGVSTPGNHVSEEDITTDGGCCEQAHEVMYLADRHVHDEVLHGATELLSEGTETEEVTKNADLGMSVMEVSQLHAQTLTTSPRPHTVNMDLGHCSSEKVEPNCVAKPYSYSSQDDQALDENNMKEKDVSSILLSPPESLGDSLPRKAPSRSPSPCSEDEHFLFSDLDENRINEQFEGSFSPKYVDKEDHLSDENGTEKLRVTSSPITIARNEDAGEENGKHAGSLPNISSGSSSLGQHVAHYPLSQSLDSTFPGKDDLKCLKSDENKEKQLSEEEAGSNDYHNSGEFESTDLTLPLGDPSTPDPSPGGNWRIWPFSLRRSGSRSALPPTPDDAKSSPFSNSSENKIITDVTKNELNPNLMKNKVRETTPTSEQLASLNLKEGRNTVTFTFSTAVLGKQQVDAQIFLWKWNTRIVISDVDGTITKSDVLGQFMPLVGVDWSQTGVAHLFSAIKENGYQLLFLSARSISQAYLTRQFLLNLKQDGKVLPDGPVVISPDGLFPSLYREVIRRVPHEFKIACLEGIKALFPSDSNPFYAGFGNRDTDEISYLKVGIPKGKIFIINPRGEVAVNRTLDTKSYTSLHALVNGMFPPTNSSEQV